MTTYFTTLSQHNNYTGPTGAKFNFGPHALNPCLKIIRIEAQIQIATPGASIAASGLIPCPYIWGVQAGPAGYTPADIITNTFSNNYIWVELLGGDNMTQPTWAPTTGPGEVMNLATAQKSWRAQRPFNANTDLYVSVANTLPSPGNFVANCLLRVWSTAP
jgi:hypothetical protein